MQPRTDGGPVDTVCEMPRSFGRAYRLSLPVVAAVLAAGSAIVLVRGPLLLGVPMALGCAAALVVVLRPGFMMADRVRISD